MSEIRCSVPLIRQQAEEIERLKKVLDKINDDIYLDSHNWSLRPCSTCRTISTLIGKPFGCYRLQKENEELVKVKNERI